MADADLIDDLPDDKAGRYAALADLLTAILDGEPNRIARLATAVSLLTSAFAPRFFWTGFYLVDPDDPHQLVVGPYQGTLGCLRIQLGRGVCGTAAASGTTVVVPDVHAFPGHIACDSRSKSEIVVPLIDDNGLLVGVLDVDSTELDAFDATDQAGLERLCAVLCSRAIDSSESVPPPGT